MLHNRSVLKDIFDSRSVRSSVKVESFKMTILNLKSPVIVGTNTIENRPSCANEEPLHLRQLLQVDNEIL